jgi:hypothetical protein
MSLLARAESKTTWHHILSFNPSSNSYLRNLTKGSHVYVEANFELREPEPTANPESPQGQRQIFLRHGDYQVYIFRVKLIMFNFHPTSETLRLIKASPSHSRESPEGN